MLLAGCGEKIRLNRFMTRWKSRSSGKPFQKSRKHWKIEKKEHKLYDSAVKLNMDDYKKIVTLSDQALSNANQRKTSESRKRQY